MPNQDFRFVDGRDGNLEVVIGANAKIFGWIKELMRENDVKCFLVLWNDESVREIID